MSLMDSVDIYCERTNEAFWSEPINALTNLAFIIAAAFAFRLLRRDATERSNIDLYFLCSMVGVIGVGSFLFHTYAQRWALLADVIPIAICLHAYVLVFARRVMEKNIVISLLCLAAYIGLGYAVSMLFDPSTFNGTISYMPSFVALLAMAAYTFVKKLAVAKTYISAVLVFTFSLTFRTIDAQVCEQFAIGTHFMWHVLNAVALYLAMKGLIKNEKYKTAF